MVVVDPVATGAVLPGEVVVVAAPGTVVVGAARPLQAATARTATRMLREARIG
jgi:hypothetical protein